MPALLGPVRSKIGGGDPALELEFEDGRRRSSINDLPSIDRWGGGDDASSARRSACDCPARELLLLAPLW